MSALNRRAFVRQMAGGVVATSLLAAIAGCGRKQAARAQLVPAGSTVLALGDSLTYGTGASPETAYPTVLAELSGWNVVNAGVSGNTSAQALERLPGLLAEHQPKLVIVSIGGNDFLRRDFPRVPLTSDTNLFKKLVALGHELIGLHTLQTAPARITGFPVAGSNEVGKVRFGIEAGAPTGRVWINDAQYFDGVPQAVWDMHIGGYRVAEKWLKDRKGRLLGYDDITHYQHTLAALARTLAIQAELDAAVHAAGGWPLQ